MNRLAALLCCAVLPLAAWAQEPPGRVARLSLVEGEAAVFADAEQGWEAARVNSHLTSENSVWTEPGSRAEVRFGTKALRLGETTQLDILRLDDDAFHAHLVRGALAVRIRETDGGESFLVTTPEARFQLRGNGRYRIETDPGRGESRLVVFSGTARLEVAGGYISVDTSRGVRVTGGERPRYEFEPAWATPLDEWALARDQRWEERESARYVPHEMTGWEDLDDYGVWRNEPEYGPVWFPTRIAVGWAPYRYGRWSWVRPWGWAWVDDAPWGYAPFHYGRWVHVGNRWGWYPGRHVARPVWAPALVGWVGGSGWSLSVSTAPTNVVGWYPLSPYEAYQPWYTANVTYINRVNRVVLPYRGDRDGRRDGRPNGRYDGRDDYRHPNRGPGATVVPRDQFGTRRPVQNVATPVSRDVVAAQPIVSGNVVLPSRNEWRQRTRPADVTPPAAAPWANDSSASRPRPAAPVTTVTPGKPPIAGAPAPQPRPGSPAAQAPAPQTRPNAFTRPAPAPVAKPSAPPASAPSAPAPNASPNAFTRPAPAGQSMRAKPTQPERVAPAPQVQQKPVAGPASPAVQRPAPVAKPAVPHQEKPGGGGNPAASHQEKPGSGPQEKPGSGPQEKPAKP